jgi:hypothetical protein
VVAERARGEQALHERRTQMRQTTLGSWSRNPRRAP